MLKNKDCKHYEHCVQCYVNEMLCNFGGRTQGGYPDCNGCNCYDRVVKEDKADVNI